MHFDQQSYDSSSQLMFLPIYCKQAYTDGSFSLFSRFWTDINQIFGITMDAMGDTCIALYWHIITRMGAINLIGPILSSDDGCRNRC